MTVLFNRLANVPINAGLYSDIFFCTFNGFTPKTVKKKCVQIKLNINKYIRSTTYNYTNDSMDARARDLKLFILTSSLTGKMFHVTIVLGKKEYL